MLYYTLVLVLGGFYSGCKGHVVAEYPGSIFFLTLYQVSLAECPNDKNLVGMGERYWFYQTNLQAVEGGH